MDGSPISVGVGLLYLAIIVGLTWRLIRRRWRYGPALTGTVHDLLNEDRRKAIELIVEEKAEARGPGGSRRESTGLAVPSLTSGS